MKYKTLTQSLDFTTSYRHLSYSKSDLGLTESDKIIYADTQLKTMDDYTGLYLETTSTESTVEVGYRKSNASTVSVTITVLYEQKGW